MKDENRLAPMMMTNNSPLTTTELSIARNRSRMVMRRPSTQQNGPEGADRGRFGRAEDPRVDAADGHDEQRENCQGSRKAAMRSRSEWFSESGA